MKVTIVADVESKHMNDDEIKMNIYSIAADYLGQAKKIDVDIKVCDVSYPSNEKTTYNLDADRCERCRSHYHVMDEIHCDKKESGKPCFFEEMEY